MSRTVSIDRSRLGRWAENFASRHGDTTASITADDGTDLLVLDAADGAQAKITISFPPLDSDPGVDPLRCVVDHVAIDRRVGALLVRRGGYAVGVFHGTKLIKHKVGTGYVQGKTKAGGWSQQRYARRRHNQARQLYDRAAAAAEMILLPAAADLEALATGGDRAGVEAVLETPALRALRPLTLPRSYPTDDPRLRTLEAFPDQFLALDIELNDLA